MFRKETNSPIFRPVPHKIDHLNKRQAYICLSDGTAPFAVHPLIAALLNFSEFQPLRTRAAEVWSQTSGFRKIALLVEVLQFLQREKKAIYLGWPFGPKLLAQALDVLAHKKFLVSKEHFVLGDAAPSAKTATEKITTLAFVTCNRIFNLSRALESYSSNTKRHGKKVEFAVFDDAQNRDAHSALKELKRRLGVPIVYAGRDEKLSFIRALANQGIPREVLDFCFFGLEGVAPTMGANRNAFLLHTVGELAFAADDDTLCRTFQAPDYKEGVRIGFEQEMEDLRSYPSVDASVNSLLERDLDLLGLHEQALAPAVQGFLRQQFQKDPQQKLDTKIMSGGFMKLISSGEAKTVVSLNGSVGDSGAVDPTFLLYLSGKGRHRLLSTEKHYNAALEGRQLIRSVQCQTILPAKKMISMFFGLNNREIVPPFFPVFRSEDTLFGMMVRDCVKNAYFAYAPWILLHLPDKRTGYSERFGTTGQVRPGDLISLEMHALRLRDTEIPTAERLKILGNRLKEVASQPLGDFKAELKKLNVETIIRSLQGMSGLLERHPEGPAFWTREVKARIAHYGKMLENPGIGTPDFFPDSGNPLKSTRYHQRILFLYGELLDWWPAITQAVAHLKKKGLRLAKPV
jgi:hypothetical protein